MVPTADAIRIEWYPGTAPRHPGVQPLVPTGAMAVRP
jgi:hypothetical protein